VAVSYFEQTKPQPKTHGLGSVSTDRNVSGGQGNCKILYSTIQADERADPPRPPKNPELAAEFEQYYQDAIQASKQKYGLPEVAREKEWVKIGESLKRVVSESESLGCNLYVLGLGPHETSRVYHQATAGYAQEWDERCQAARYGVLEFHAMVRWREAERVQGKEPRFFLMP
jgi:hypothetical protein